MTKEADEELNRLRQRAKLLNIPHAHLMSKSSLEEKINLALMDKAESELSKEEVKDSQREAWEDAMRLVRLRIANLNPDNREVPGEIITIYSQITGRVSKFIPFDPAYSASGYHVPNIIYQFLKNKKFISRTVRPTGINGREEVITREMNEYALEVLPPLTYDELKELAAKQHTAETVA